MTPEKTEYTCIRDDQIQKQSRKIERLETRVDYKESKIDDLYLKMDKLEDKMDTIISSFNELKLQSKTDDNELELRLKGIETELELQKQHTQDMQTRYSLLLASVTLIFVVLTFYFNYLH